MASMSLRSPVPEVAVKALTPPLTAPAVADMAPYYFWIIKKLACIEKTVKRKRYDISHIIAI